MAFDNSQNSFMYAFRQLFQNRVVYNKLDIHCLRFLFLFWYVFLTVGLLLLHIYKRWVIFSNWSCNLQLHRFKDVYDILTSEKDILHKLAPSILETILQLKITISIFGVFNIEGEI